MARINILPQAVYNRIAAGEVIEKPYSVVKELVENAIDAGATEIEVYVEGGGTQLIRVVDNGCGIERSDLHAAFLPHATSKIEKVQDLENIVTLGFRGEAVASIASVSKMTITSKTENGKCYRLTSNGGELGEIIEVAGQKGTEVAVETLFFNQPVRFKFLRTARAEEGEITTFISRFILNRPDISFTYTLNGKRVLQSFGGGFEEAMAGVYGASVLAQCFHIDAEKNGIRIHGYIGNQNFYKPNKSYQTVFLNGRFVQNTTIATAVSTAYNNYLMKRQYPFYVLNVDVPTEVVDVNVHPNKSDVRFADNRIIYASIYSVINAVLEGNAKALEYVVQPAAQPQETEKTAQKDGAPLLKEDEWTKPRSISLDILGIAEEDQKIQPKASSNSVFERDEIFTYEDAKKEIKDLKPVFNMPTNDADKPIEIDEEAWRRGFTPIDQIPDFDPIHLIRPSIEEGYIPIIKKENSKADVQTHLKSYGIRNITFEDSENEQGVHSKADAFAENKRLLENMEKARQEKIPLLGCKYVGKLFNTYLLYERLSEVYIIDQHAAHERLIFDKLKEKMKNRTIARQAMFVPFELKLNSFEAEFIRERIEDIREMGFDINEVSDTEFSVESVPSDLRNINLGVFFNDILGDVKGFRSIKLEDILKDKLASAACKAAVRGGMDLTQLEVETLVNMMDGNMGLKCPHGRPVVVKMAKSQLEKMFKRIV
jgi:DNA mismatch repair protein MutL